MPKFFVNTADIQNNMIKITNEDVKHISNVLRSNIGDKLHIGNQENGKNYEAEIISIKRDEVSLKILNEYESEAEPKIYINILQGLPKADKMEFVIQKSIEIGVKEITPLIMERCIVRLNAKEELKKNERWKKIASSAAKQSGRDIIPIINNCIKIEEIKYKLKEYDYIIVAYENERKNMLKNELLKIKRECLNKDTLKIAIIIGPEGGISEEEISYLKNINARIISLR